MLVGPFSETQFNKLKSILDRHQVAFTFNEVDAAPQEDPQRLNYSDHRRYTATTLKDFIYVEVEANALLNLSEELEQAGVSLKPSSEEPELHFEEYLCPVCGYTASNPRLCPKHARRLLPFTEWAQAREVEQKKQSRTRTVVFLVIGALIYALITTFSR